MLKYSYTMIIGGTSMSDIVYFIPGNNGRYINRGWKAKITIGDKISQEGYYIGEAMEKERCWIFYGKPYVPTDTDIPSYINFDPNCCRRYIIQDTIRYFLVRHKKSGAYFVICSYLIDRLSQYKGLYFANLLSFIDGNWKTIEQWPFKAERARVTNDKIGEYWRKYNNYYEEDFEIIREIKGS